MNDDHRINAKLMNELIELRQMKAEFKASQRERMQAEEALKEKIIELDCFINNIPDMAWLKNEESNFIAVNKAFADTVGMSTEALINNTCAVCFGEENAQKFKEVEQKVINGKKQIIFEEEIIDSQQNKVILETIKSPIFNSAKEVVGTVGISRNITQRKLAEEALRESEKRHRTVLEAGPDPVVVYDMAGKVVYLNPAFTEVFGWTLTERLGRKMDDFVPRDAWPETRNMIELAMAGKSFSHFETRRYTKAGKVVDVSISAAFYKDNAGKPVGSVVNLRDITERKKLEIQLKQAHKMEAIGTLTGGIAHDFNNILGIILGNTELALDDIPEWNPVHSFLKEIQAAGLRAKGIVRQLLGYIRKTDLNRKPVKLVPVINAGLKFLRATIPTNIEIRSNIQATVDTIQADATQINQVMLNLGTNAWHAMDDTGGIMEVAVKNVVLDQDSTSMDPELIPGSYIEVTLSDTGQGITPDIIERIFDPYFTTKELGKGTGLGLSVVHGIVKGYGGAITVDSELGKGTTFRIYFPLVEKEAVSDTEADKNPPGGNERILFVDDETSIVKIGRQMLGRLGYRVQTKKSAIEALELFRSKPDGFDLVITDLMMPDITGDKLAKEILNIRPDMPIILCTGFSEKFSEESAQKIGIRRYIEKPLDTVEFAKTIRKVLDESDKNV